MISYPYQVSDLISQNIRTVGTARLLIANYEFGYGKNTGNFINVLSKKLAKKFLDTLHMQFFLAKFRCSTVTIGTKPQACIAIENYANLSSWSTWLAKSTEGQRRRVTWRPYSS